MAPWPTSRTSLLLTDQVSQLTGDEVPRLILPTTSPR
jgi:hypothetical protein